MSDTPQKVLVLAYSDIRYDPRILKQCEALQEHGYAVEYYGVRYDDKDPATGFPAHLMLRRAESGKGKFIQYFLLMLAFFGKTFTTARQRPIVFVHNMPNFLVLATLWLKVWGCKVVLDIHDDPVLALKGKSQNKFAHKLLAFVENTISLRVPDALMTVNQLFVDKYRALAKKPVHLLHNSPDVENALPAVEYSAGTEIRLKFIGHMGAHYGVERLIRYVGKLEQKIPVHLDVHGDGSTRKSLERLTDELGLKDRVKFHGRFRPQELKEILREGHIGVAPYEVNELTNVLLPVKLLEYTFHGLASMSAPLAVTKTYFPDDSILYMDDFEAFSDILHGVYEGNIDLKDMQSNALEKASKLAWSKEKSQFLKFVDNL